MSISYKGSWKEIAWNGISFLAPDIWQAGIIEKQYLMLEDDSGPVMELKWNHIKGAFSHKTHLNRLASLNRKGPGKGLEKCAIPPEWKSAVKHYKASAFVWGKGGISGKGLILYCPECKKALLIQFYQINNQEVIYPFERILDSLRDHNEGDKTVYSIFDIRIEIPEPFRLKRHRFESGNYELEFYSPKGNIIVYLWGPASIILKDINLVRFAGNLIMKPEREFSILDGGRIIEWYQGTNSNHLQYLWNKIKWGYSCRMFKIWHDVNLNRILAVYFKSKKGQDKHLFNRICESYAVVQQQRQH